MTDISRDLWLSSLRSALADALQYLLSGWESSRRTLLLILSDRDHTHTQCVKITLTHSLSARKLAAYSHQLILSVCRLVSLLLQYCFLPLAYLLRLTDYHNNNNNHNFENRNSNNNTNNKNNRHKSTFLDDHTPTEDGILSLEEMELFADLLLLCMLVVPFIILANLLLNSKRNTSNKSLISQEHDQAKTTESSPDGKNRSRKKSEFELLLPPSLSLSGKKSHAHNRGSERSGLQIQTLTKQALSDHQSSSGASSLSTPINTLSLSPMYNVARFTDRSGLSSLTPDSAFREIAWRMATEDSDLSESERDAVRDDHENENDELLRKRNEKEDVMLRSVEDPAALVGWRVFVERYGLGTVIAIKRKKFSTTRFEIQFDNGTRQLLPLKRNQKKGSVAFTPIKKLR